EQERSRFLKADELPRFIAALSAAPQPWRDYFEVLLFVGFRRSATAAMRWQDVNLDNGTWTVPKAKSKSGDELVLPLTGRALATLKRRHRRRGNSQWVFPGGSNAGHLGRAKRSLSNLLAAAKIPDLHLHDLRRSLGSWLAMSGHSLPEIGRVLGHKDHRSTQVYARLQIEPVAAAAALAQKAMLQAARKKPARHG
ncbi:MAG: site-specific integrase, partial [Terriglobales bacterium]